jgi:hypothetical protein
MIEQLIKDINAMHSIGMVLPMLIMFGLGVIMCFYGYRLFKILLIIFGFAVGFALSGMGGMLATENPVAALLLGLGGGTVCAILFTLFYPVAVFILGGVICAAIGGLALKNEGIAVFLGLVGGVLSLVIQKFMIILLTAFSGATAIVSAFAFFVFGNELIPLQAVQKITTNFHGYLDSAITHEVIQWALCFIIGIVGTVFQYRNIAHLKQKTSPIPDVVEDTGSQQHLDNKKNEEKLNKEAEKRMELDKRVLFQAKNEYSECVGGKGHHWGVNDKTHKIVRTCPKCNGIFHGAEFKTCGECNCSLVDSMSG